VHAAHASADVEWASAVAHMERSAALTRPVDQATLEWLAVPPGARVADVGCGAGGMTVLLAAAVGPTGQVVAVDGERALLEATAHRADREGVGDRVTTIRHDLAAGVPRADAFDLIWAAHVVHHLPDQQAALDGLAALLTPGGRLALAEGGLPSRGLPWDLGVGEPGLHDRLAAAVDAWFGSMRNGIDGARRMPYGWSTAMANAGLVDVDTRTFLLDVAAPLTAEQRTHLVDEISGQVERLAERLSADDVAAWERLLDPDAAEYLGRRDDTYRLSANTVHVGTRP